MLPLAGRSEYWLLFLTHLHIFNAKSTRKPLSTGQLVKMVHSAVVIPVPPCKHCFAIVGSWMNPQKGWKICAPGSAQTPDYSEKGGVGFLCFNTGISCHLKPLCYLRQLQRAGRYHAGLHRYTFPQHELEARPDIPTVPKMILNTCVQTLVPALRMDVPVGLGA